MTTRVKIVNEGPNTVKIEVQGRNDGGQFTQVDEKELEPGRFADVYIHSTQSFQVVEVKDSE